MIQIHDISKLEFHHRQGGQFRWITISTLMLAIGTILHLVSPSVAGITPNWTIATYCVAICLTKPTYRQALGIGLVAALVNVLTSKSGFPYGNLISEPIGALSCAFIVHHFSFLRFRGHSLLPVITGIISTCLSGGVFVTILKFVMDLPMVVYTAGMLPLVGVIGLLNGIVTPVMYYPALRLFVSRGVLDSLEEQMVISDHSQFDLKPVQEELISLEHVSYIYNKQKIPVLNDINLNIHEGDFLVIAGESGSGKSSLCMTLTGAIPHYFGGVMKGMVYVDGKATTQTTISDLACHVGMMLDDYDSQLVAMTVEEEIAFSLENQGVNPKIIKEAITSALDKVGLTEYRTRELSKLSGGQRQRLVIAGVLVTNPDILVFDEPTSALDPEGTNAFYKLIHTLNTRYGHTVVIVEHTLEAALPYANRMVLIDHGRILCDSDVETVLRYMYDTHIYVSAIPHVFACQLNLEEMGYNLGSAWLSTELAVQELQEVQ
ncbi:MAG: ATP-binding cassette domain-containing protein [Megasphaera sp.]|jgi:energy-coupling factor transport system ATP-binding protein|uniref:tryptophan transporter n=1 Tax=Megasphaera sueciensis TaxID=349094 RepID=UPI003D03E117|nr:ATP-binding cassette domain-containing protein [Megasphaera sp.]MCI1822574.1 ATP-binding cassette domain-containing protein [Megasphaera sp.]